jgi:type IV pilus assembly protein PilC
MPKFKYVAKAQDGNQTTGVVEASNESEAAESLRYKKLAPVSITPQGGAGPGLLGNLFAPKGKRRPSGRVKGDELVIFTRQLSTMINAGIPILEALEIMVEQTANARFKWSLQDAVNAVRTGSDLSTAFARHPKIFNNIYVSMVKAAEASGQIDTILIRLAEYQEANAQLKREVRAAMTYPVVSLTLVLGITVFLMVGIVPKFKEIYDSIQNIELPMITQVMLNTSLAFRAHVIEVLGGAVALIVAVVVFVKTPAGRRQWDRIKLKLPIFGTLFRKIALARFSRTFSTLIKSGVPMLGALEITSATAGNVIIQEAISGAREAVRQGEGLATPLSRSSVFPPMVTRMVSVGERSGSLELLLEKIADFYDQQVKAAVESLTSMIEPLMIAFMGGLVGSIVFAVFLPILKLQQALSK